MDAYTSFAAVYDMFMDNVPYDIWADNIDELLQQYVPENMPDPFVAELGCGTGEITQRLAAKHYDMIGIDSSIEMLEIAREKSSDSGILYICQDMREFELYGTVEAVVSVCDSMNYITSDTDMLKVFRLVNNYLGPGGIFLFDMNTPYKYEKVLADNTFAENREEGSFIWENTFDKKTGINQYDLTLYIRDDISDNEVKIEADDNDVDEEYEDDGHSFFRFEEQHLQKAYQPSEIISLLKQAGLKPLAIYDVESMKKLCGEDISAELDDTDYQRLYFLAEETTKQAYKG